MGKGGAQISPAVAAVGVAIVVIVVVWFLWSKTGKQTAVVKNPEDFKAAYQKATANQPGNSGGGAGASQMQEAINRAHAGVPAPGSAGSAGSGR